MLSRRHLLMGLAAAPLARGFAYQDEPRFATGVTVVNVLATVRDGDGKIVGDLTIDDFLLEEDGRPLPIRYFSRQTDLPLTVGLLVDSSGSVRNVLGDEKKAAVKFLRQVLRPGQDRAFVIRFDLEIELMQDLTSSLPRLEDAVNDIATTPPFRRFQSPFQFPRRQRFPVPGPGPLPPIPRTPPPARGGGRAMGTCLYDAVFLGADEILRLQEGRKAMVLISDGLDAGSKVSQSTAIEAAQRADSLVYSIRFGSNNEGARATGTSVLRRFADETGGAFFDPGSKNLDRVFASIEEELRNQYNLGFTPDLAGTGYRRIRVSTKRPGLKVRARDGYYAGL
jgi:VWFA-related protein